MQEQQITNLTQQPNVKLMYCSACQIHTNHHRTQSGAWVCWCGNQDEPPATDQPAFPSGSLSARRDFILYEIAQGRGELTDDVIGELAELDGSETSWNTQLLDAGYAGGVL